MHATHPYLWPTATSTPLAALATGSTTFVGVVISEYASSTSCAGSPASSILVLNGQCVSTGSSSSTSYICNTDGAQVTVTQSEYSDSRCSFFLDSGSVDGGVCLSSPGEGSTVFGCVLSGSCPGAGCTSCTNGTASRCTGCGPGYVLGAATTCTYVGFSCGSQCTNCADGYCYTCTLGYTSENGACVYTGGSGGPSSVSGNSLTPLTAGQDKSISEAGIAVGIIAALVFATVHAVLLAFSLTQRGAVVFSHPAPFPQTTPGTPSLSASAAAAAAAEGRAPSKTNEPVPLAVVVADWQVPSGATTSAAPTPVSVSPILSAVLHVFALLLLDSILGLTFYGGLGDWYSLGANSLGAPTAATAWWGVSTLANNDWSSVGTSGLLYAQYTVYGTSIAAATLSLASFLCALVMALRTLFFLRWVTASPAEQQAAMSPADAADHFGSMRCGAATMCVFELLAAIVGGSGFAVLSHAGGGSVAGPALLCTYAALATSLAMKGLWYVHSPGGCCCASRRRGSEGQRRGGAVSGNVSASGGGGATVSIPENQHADSYSPPHAVYAPKTGAPQPRAQKQQPEE